MTILNKVKNDVRLEETIQSLVAGLNGGVDDQIQTDSVSETAFNSPLPIDEIKDTIIDYIDPDYIATNWDLYKL